MSVELASARGLTSRNSPYFSLVLARGEPGLGRRQNLRRADMQPVAVMDQAAQAPGRLRAVIDDVQRERPIWSIGEQPRMQYLHSGENEGRIGRVAAAVQTSVIGAEEVSRPFIAEGPDHRFQQPQHV